MKAVEPDDQDALGDADEPEIILSDQDDLEDVSFLSDDDVPAGPSRKKFDKIVPDDMYESFDENSSEDNDYDWSHSLRQDRFKPYSKNKTKTPTTRNIIQDEVIMLSSD